MITIIAAVAENNALGKDNKLIWHLPADLKRFKKVTANHHVIMGRKTFESLGKPLPNRTNIIVTHNTNFSAENCIVVNSLQQALKAVKNDENPFILGGAEIYKQAIEIADKLDITFVHHKFEADVFFPEIDKSVWKETRREHFDADEKNKYDYSFVTFERI
ncbi:dihydrofolate reductase [Lutibacter sp.]|uniref:dihydrofolate reductase n=1 Tax=Lutibacter sp. TaxID=1925666 RepID=UPI0025B9B876|nr:dihydrofolate reductase [Lutibacter sp.]MCF6167219.1 dihydrofolate reductase [Lutibacter sp.]